MKDNPIDQMAFDWLVRADAGLTSEDEVRFLKWLEADSRHYGAYIRAKAVFAHAHRIKALSHSPDPEDWMVFIGQGRNELTREPVHSGNGKRTGKKVSRRAFFGGAGATAIAVLTTGYFLTSQPAAALTFQTGLGERKEVRLADGTKVALNTDSMLRVVFDDVSRTVELIRGEVMYDVASDHHRPFVVKAREFKIRASKSSFVIQQLPTVRPQLIVREGEVELTPVHATSLAVSAPTKVTFLTGNRLSGAILSKAEMDRELLWREGKIAFDDMPLRNAIAAFKRYGPVQFNIENRHLLNQTVSGVFSSDNPKGFAYVVAQLFDLTVNVEGNIISMRSKE